MSRYLLSSLTCGSVLLTATTAAAHTPQSGRTTSAVEQLGLDDTPAATPFSILKDGARYHYPISVFGDDDLPLHQRTGVFTAAVAQSK